MAIAAITAMMATTEISSISVKADRRLVRERIMRPSLFADAKLARVEVCEVVVPPRRIGDPARTAHVRHGDAADRVGPDDRGIEREAGAGSVPEAARPRVRRVRLVRVAHLVDARAVELVGAGGDDLVAVAGVELAAGVEVRANERLVPVRVQQTAAIEPRVGPVLGVVAVHAR